MAITIASSSSLKPPSPFNPRGRLSPPSARTTRFRVEAGAGRKIKTDKPYGINGGLALKDGADASGRTAKGKGVYQFVDKYGANVDGYSPIYNEEDWSPSGDVYVGVIQNWNHNAAAHRLKLCGASSSGWDSIAGVLKFTPSSIWCKFLTTNGKIIKSALVNITGSLPSLPPPITHRNRRCRRRHITGSASG